MIVAHYVAFHGNPSFPGFFSLHPHKLALSSEVTNAGLLRRGCTHTILLKYTCHISRTPHTPAVLTSDRVAAGASACFFLEEFISKLCQPINLPLKFRNDGNRRALISKQRVDENRKVPIRIQLLQSCVQQGQFELC
jgi:hypothetical protein